MNWTLALFLTALATTVVAGATAAAAEPIGIENMLAFDRLPFFKDGVTVHYEGSIDKRGGNADWDWWLYEAGDEWVIFDVDGPGCIYNFAQHRYPSSAEPTFRFYFDGEKQPRFVIRQSEFGRKAPFVEPFAGIFVGDDPVPSGRGPIWVVRSFVPMPFARSCRITSSVKLEGFDRAKGHGGWGHVVYHSFATADGVSTFTGAEDYSRLLAVWRNVGADPKPSDGNERIAGTISITGSGSSTILDRTGEGSIASVRLWLNPFQVEHLHDLFVRIHWDDDSTAAVDCPLGSFFGNEFGHHDQRYLTHGMTTGGEFYNYFPMPFWRAARVELVNRGNATVSGVKYEIQVRPSGAMTYPKQRCGYFRASTYYPRTPAVTGRDSKIAEIRGRGHLVAGHVCGWSVGDRIVSCEGDVRVYIDGNATPQVESDGSESWGCYGWGFPSPPQNNPTSGYDGSGPPLFTWSQVRVMTGDWYPFRRGLRFNIEAGGHTDWPMGHSGIVFYYGLDTDGIELTDTLDVCDAASEAAHEYRSEGAAETGELTASYEGSEDTAQIADVGRAVRDWSEFTVSVRPENQGVMLRRRSDQANGRQRARVYVDGALVSERTWYYADRNPHKRWLDDEFEIPSHYSRDKEKIRVRIEPVNGPDESRWNEYRYWVFSYLGGT